MISSFNLLPAYTFKTAPFIVFSNNSRQEILSGKPIVRGRTVSARGVASYEQPLSLLIYFISCQKCHRRYTSVYVCGIFPGFILSHVVMVNCGPGLEFCTELQRTAVGIILAHHNRHIQPKQIPWRQTDTGCQHIP